MPQQRKRRKIELLGTFDQFKQSQEEHKQEESEAEMIMSQTQQVHPLAGAMDTGIMNQVMNQPNVIGNIEDKTVEMKQFNNVEVSASSDDLNQSEVLVAGKDSDDDIPPMQVRSRRQASKTRY